MNPFGTTTLDIKTNFGRGKIVTDPDTGGQKEGKLARFDLIPPDFLWELAEHYGKGCKKYDDNNWRKGYQWSLSVAALQRHLNLWLQGETFDKETNSHHLVAAAWHCIALWWFERHVKGTNNLNKPGFKHEDLHDRQPEESSGTDIVAQVEAALDADRRL